MKLYLSELEQDQVIGIYGPNKDRLANRMRFLHPDAAKSYLKMSEEKLIKCSDMYRTFDASLKAHLKKGAARPGYSGHNFGFSIDIDTRWVIKANHFADKKELDEWMASHGWYCHNPPGETRSKESWHFNYFGDEAEKYLAVRTDAKRTWARPLEQKIQDVYGFWWDLEKVTVEAVQSALADLKMYGGDIDGKRGEMTREAIQMFRTAWGLGQGADDARMVRTLMCVSSERCVADETC
jgi:hypothetical protein